LETIDARIYKKKVNQANSEREITSLFQNIATAKSQARNRNLTYNEQLENHPKDPSNSDTHLLLITKRHWLESEKKVLHHEVEWATAMIKRNDNMINKNALDIAIAAYNAADQRLKATEEEDAIVYKKIEIEAAEADPAASIQIEAAEDPKNSSRGARTAQTRLNRFDAKTRARAAAGYITNLLKRKSGGMVTRKKKYRKRNKTKRNKRQKKRYTKKYNMRY
jgi:hypothetical protein